MLGGRDRAPSPPQSKTSAAWIVPLGLPGLLEPAPESGKDGQIRSHQIRIH